MRLKSPQHTGHSWTVDLQGDEDVRRRSLVLLCKLFHYGLLEKRGLVGAKRRIRGDHDAVPLAFLHDVFLHAQPKTW